MTSQIWVEQRLGDLLEIKHGYAFLGEYFSDSGSHIVLTPGNFIDSGGFKSKGEKEKWYKGPIPPEYVLNKDDLIVAMTEQAEGLLGSSALVPVAGLYLHNQRLGLVQIKRAAKTDKGFLYYLFNTISVRQQICASASGLKVRHTAPSRIAEVKVSVPPLPTQRKIAAILSAYDDLIENNLRRIKILEEMARSLYREWFVNFRFPGHQKVRMVNSPLGKIPEGWEAVPFTEIADVLSGGTPKTQVEEYWNGDIPFFTPRDATAFFYVTDTEKHGTELGLRSCNSQLYPKDTVFITARGTVGKVNMPTVPMLMNQSCYALVGKNGISQPFLFFATLNSVETLQKNTGGATFDTIIVDTFRRLMVLKPALSPVKKFAALAIPMLDGVVNLIRRNENLRKTRDLLLPKLISGDLDVSNLDIKLREKSA